jgi:outer membrane immunogenic protein
LNEYFSHLGAKRAFDNPQTSRIVESCRDHEGSLTMSRIRAIAIALATTTIVPATHALADGPPQMRRTTTADPYAYTPPPEQLFYNWSGAYIGGHIGAGWGNDQATLTTVAAEPFTHRSSTFVGGGQAGYMHQFRELVLGAEVKYSWSGMEFSHASTASPGLSSTTRVNDITTVTGRLGYAYMNWLAYWKAGWATAGIEHTASGTSTGTASSRGNGWVAGAGLSYAFGPNIIGGVEYDYVRVNADAAQPVPGVATLSGSGLDLQSVTFRLDFKFGH